MKTLHKLALAAGLPAVAIAAFGQAASAAGTVPPTSPPVDASAAEPAAVPAGWQTLVDDTGLLTLSAPPTWSDVDTVPAANDDGTPRAWLEASTDIEAFHESFQTAGVILTALPHSPDLQATLVEYDVGSCGEQVVEPYAEGAFTGLIEHQDCGDGVEYYRLAVDSAANPAVTLLLQVGVTADDEPGTADAIIASMALTAGGVPSSSTPATPTLAPVPTVPVATTATAAPTAPATVPATAPTPAPTTVPAGPTTAGGVPTVPGAATTVPGAVTTVPGAVTTVAGPTPPTVAGAVAITDDTGSITVAVPPTWTQVTTSPSDGAQPRISASPDQALFQPAEGQPDTYSVPGLIYMSTDLVADTAAAAAGLSLDDCTDGGVQPYSDGTFTGHVQVNTDCAGTTTRVYTVVASPADQSFTAVLLIQLTEPGDAELNTILRTFNYTPAG